MKAKQFKIIFLTFLSTVKFQAILFRCSLYEQNGIILKLSTYFYITFQKLFTSNVNICLWKRDLHWTLQLIYLYAQYQPVQVKVSAVSLHAKQALRTDTSIDLPIPEFGATTLVTATPRPLCPREGGPISIVQEAGWFLGRSGRGREISPMQGFETRTIHPIVSRYTDYDIPDPISTSTDIN
jgi:hypothetical protein